MVDSEVEKVMEAKFKRKTVVISNDADKIIKKYQKNKNFPNFDMSLDDFIIKNGGIEDEWVKSWR